MSISPRDGRPDVRVTTMRTYARIAPMNMTRITPPMNSCKLNPSLDDCCRPGRPVTRLQIMRSGCDE
jgi:hypothetical protein